MIQITNFANLRKKIQKVFYHFLSVRICYGHGKNLVESEFMRHSLMFVDSFTSFIVCLLETNFDAIDSCKVQQRKKMYFQFFGHL